MALTYRLPIETMVGKVKRKEEGKRLSSVPRIQNFSPTTTTLLLPPSLIGDCIAPQREMKKFLSFQTRGIQFIF